MQGYLDFTYALKDGMGHTITVNPLTLQNPPSDQAPDFIIPPASNGASGCQWPTVAERDFIIDLAALYPGLAAGTYSLTVKFAPRDNEVSPIALMPVSFSIH